MAGHQTSGGYDSMLIEQEEHIHLGNNGYKAVMNYGFDGTNPVAMSPTLGKLVSEKFDYISVAQTNATTETYTYKTGGSGGTTVATVTVVYVDSTKADLASVART